MSKLQRKDTLVITPTPHSSLLLWLDPESALAAEDWRIVSLAGWTVKSVHTYDELADLAPHAAAAVIRLSSSCDRIKGAQQALAEASASLVLFARVDREALELAVEATHLGVSGVLAADDWKLASWQRLYEVSDQRGDKRPAAKSSVTVPQRIRHVVFVDPASQHLLALAQRVAQAEVTALLVGPTGSGKEVMARVLHEASPRASGPFVALNCAAMPDNLIEDLLFGHEKGAFTGAHRDHKGLFEQAQGGTIFLDEIGEMPLHLQSKLLRVLQERQLTRLGGNSSVHLNVRVVAATNKDLREAIARKEFREDLYYRIATFRMTLLPLRERPGDIIPLALQVIGQHGSRHLPWQLDQQAREVLLQHSWPGNVRELENVMRRAMVLCADGMITTHHLMFDDWANQPITEPVMTAPAVYSDRPAAFSSAASPLPLPTIGSPAVNDALACADADVTPPAPGGLHHAVRVNEHQLIMATIAASSSRNEAAKRLGISPRTLRYKLAQMREMGLALTSAAA